MTEAIKEAIFKRLVPKVRYRGHQIKSLMAAVYLDLLHYDQFKKLTIVVKDAITAGLIKANVCNGVKYYTKNRRYKMETITKSLEVVTVDTLNKGVLLDLYLTVINEYRGDNTRLVSTGEYMKAIECITALLNRKVKDYEPPVDDDLEETLDLLRKGKLDGFSDSSLDN